MFISEARQIEKSIVGNSILSTNFGAQNAVADTKK